MAQFEWLAQALSLICGKCFFRNVRLVLSGALGAPHFLRAVVTVFSQQPTILAIASLVWRQSVMMLKSWCM